MTIQRTPDQDIDPHDCQSSEWTQSEHSNNNNNKNTSIVIVIVIVIRLIMEKDTIANLQVMIDVCLKPRQKPKNPSAGDS